MASSCRSGSRHRFLSHFRGRLLRQTGSFVRYPLLLLVDPPREVTRVVGESMGAHRAVLRADADDLAAIGTFLRPSACYLPTIPKEPEVSAYQRSRYRHEDHQQYEHRPRSISRREPQVGEGSATGTVFV